MVRSIILLILLFSPALVIGSTDDDDDDSSINLQTRSSVNATIRRYCVQLAKLPNGRTVDVMGFDWHTPYIVSPSVNACSIDDIKRSLPGSFPSKTLIIVTEHQCKMTEHAWNIQSLYGSNISLMILTNRTNTNYELTYNTTGMPVSIPVLIFWQNDYDRMKTVYGNLSAIEISITYAPDMPRKFRPAILLMFLLVLCILLSGNFWAADEFIRKIKHQALETPSESTTSNSSSESSNRREPPINNSPGEPVEAPARSQTTSPRTKPEPNNSEPAILYMPYCIIVLILSFAIGWILLIYYFPKVMIYILQGMKKNCLLKMHKSFL